MPKPDDWLTQLRPLLPDAPPELLSRVLTEAQQLAVDDVREILRAAWREKLLAQMIALLGEEEVADLASTGSGSASDASTNSASGREDEAEEARRAAVAAEIAAIRAQIVANEQKLARAQTEVGSALQDESLNEEEPLVGMGWYLYGVTPTAVLPLPQTELVAPPTAVESIPHADLQAIVSPIPFDQFSPQQIEQAELAWLAAKAEAHQNVLAALLPHATVLPLRFGTLCRTREDVQQLLQENRAVFQQNLADLTGQTEWGVKIFFAGESLTEYVRQHLPDVQHLEQEMATQGAGRAYFGRKKMAQVVDTAVRQTQEQIVADCHEKLTQHAHKTRLNPLPNAELTGTQATPLLNGAYLIPHDAQDNFAQQVKQLQESYAPLGFEILLTGPWPPYNFVNLDISAAS